MSEAKEKVVITVGYPISVTDGTTVRARQVMEVLRKRFDVTVLSRSAPGDGEYAERLRQKGIDVVLRPSRKKLWPIALVRSLPRLRPDLVYCEADIYGFLAMIPLSRIMGFKAVYEAQALAGMETMQFSKVKGVIYYLMESVVGRSADAVVALSLRTKSFFSMVNRRTRFIPVFIDTLVFKPGERRDGGQTKRVGLVGPFDNLFNAFQLKFLVDNLGRFDPRIAFVLIGECPAPPSSPRISLTGFLPSVSEYASAIRGLDALLVPVDRATFGPKNKVLEALASCVPVFMTEEAAVGLDFAESGSNSFVFPKEELVDRMNSLLFDDEAMAKVAAGGRTMVLKWYDRDTCGRELIGLIAGMAELGLSS